MHGVKQPWTSACNSQATLDDIGKLFPITEKVKWYAPRIRHVVLDVSFSSINSAS